MASLAAKTIIGRDSAVRLRLIASHLASCTTIDKACRFHCRFR